MIAAYSYNYLPPFITPISPYPYSPSISITSTQFISSSYISYHFSLSHPVSSPTLYLSNSLSLSITSIRLSVYNFFIIIVGILLVAICSLSTIVKVTIFSMRFGLVLVVMCLFGLISGGFR